MSESNDRKAMGATPTKNIKKEAEGENPQGYVVKGTSVDRADLSILFKISKLDGESLPFGTVNKKLVGEIFQNRSRHYPTGNHCHQ